MKARTLTVALAMCLCGMVTVAATLTDTVTVDIEEVSVIIDSAAAEPSRAIKAMPSLDYRAEVMAATSSRHTPFWLLNNRMGLSSLQQNNGYVRGAVFKRLDTSRRFSWGAGIDLAVPWHFTSRFVVQQLYGEVKYRSLELAVGSKQRYMGLVNLELGSGDMTFSQNARPVPQIFLSMPRYEWVPWTKHWVAVKGFISYGIFTDGRWQKDHVGPDGRWAKNVLYHSKGGFMRIGDPSRHPLTLEGGFEMAAEFGGTIHIVDPVTGEHRVVHQPHGIKSIIKAFIPGSGDSGGTIDQMGEATNIEGNHLGQWSAALTFKPRGSGWGLRAYYQHYFDDHSMMFLEHDWRDMLAGFEVSFPKNRFIDQFVYEFLTTKDQSGAVYWDHTPEIPEQVSGRDDYYNNYLYPGWSHWGMGMGNPLVISPIYNADGSLMFWHNRVEGHHFGLKGTPADCLDYRVLISYTRSWGRYNDPLPDIARNFNAMLEVGYHPASLSGWDFRLALGADGGRLLGKSFGAMLSVSRSGVIFGKDKK